MRVRSTPPDSSALAKDPVTSVYSGLSIILYSAPILAIWMAESLSSYSLRRSRTAVLTSSTGMPVLAAMAVTLRFSGLE